MDPIAYTVVGGETLEDIARNVLGDASLWWRIAEANSLAVSGDGALTAGQTLTVPKLSLNANSVETCQPYGPSSDGELGSSAECRRDRVHERRDVTFHVLWPWRSACLPYLRS